MSGPFKENWKRLSNRFPPNTTASAMEDKDILRIEDVSIIFAASGVVTASGIPTSGDLLVGAPGGWVILPSGSEGEVLKIINGAVAWGPDASGITAGFVVGPASATNNAIALYDGTTGKLIKNSNVTIDSSGNIFTSGNITSSGTIIANTINVTNLTLQNLNLTGSVGDILYATGVDAFGNLPIGSAGEVLTVVGGSPSWAAPSGGATAGAPVPVTMATAPSTTILSSDYFVAVSGQGTAQTVFLPASPSDGERKIIKDSQGIAATGSITVDGNGALMDGVSSFSLVNNYEAVSLIFSSTLGQWQLV